MRNDPPYSDRMRRQTGRAAAPSTSHCRSRRPRAIIPYNPLTINATMVRRQGISSAERSDDRTIFAREFFDLQFTFAERVSALSGMPLERALFAYTNLYVRFGLGRDFDPEHDRWRAYIDGLRTAGDGRAWTYRFYLNDAEANTAPSTIATFGCFSYALQEGNVVRLHFRNAEPDSSSPLGASRDDRRRAELATLFAHMRSEVPEDAVVVGVSWLYNLPAYRRLFPPAYIASARPRHGLFRSMPLWGQFVDHRGGVKPAVSGPFMEAVAGRTSLESIGECFPLKALTVEAPVGMFYEFYGVQGHSPRWPGTRP